MLKASVIKSDPSLATLSDDQIKVLETLSANDENAVIGAKTGEIHGRYEADVKEVTGVEKGQGEKSYDYMKRVMGDFKSKAEASGKTEADIQVYKNKIINLEKAIAEDSSDIVLKQQLTDMQSKLTLMEDLQKKEKATYEEQINSLKGEIRNTHVSTAFDAAIAGLKFKPEYPANVQKTLIDSTKSAVLSGLKPDWVETGDTRTMVFRNEKGDIMRNPNNKLEPYTAAELMRERLAGMLSDDKKSEGAGTKSPDGKGGVFVDLVDVSQANNQVEADDIISKYLMQKGLLKTSAEFSVEQQKIRKENKVETLPIR